MRTFNRLAFVSVAVFLLAAQALWASGDLLDRDFDRLEKARDTHLAEIERAFDVYATRVERANSTLTRIYEQLIKQYKNRGETEVADQLQRELEAITDRALTMPFPAEGLAGASNDNSENKAGGHEALINAIGPEVVNAGGRRAATAGLANYDYAVLYFTAGWCGPCRAFTPELIQFYQQNKSVGSWEVIVVSRDRSEQEFYDYLNSANMPWAAVPFARVEHSQLPQRLGIRGIPALVVLDRNGNTVITSNNGGRSKALADLLARLRQ